MKSFERVFVLLSFPLCIVRFTRRLYNNRPQLTAQYVQVLRDSNARNNLYSRGAANTFAGAKPYIVAGVSALPLA